MKQPYNEWIEERHNLIRKLDDQHLSKDERIELEQKLKRVTELCNQR